MMLNNNNEALAEKAFSAQSPVFDATYAPNEIIRYKRQRVRQHLQQFLQPNSNILELNSGTGQDAAYLAHLGHSVHATDISEGMQVQLQDRVDHLGLEEQISTELCSFTALNELKNKGPYDYIFSNFGGLNCTENLAEVLSSFSGLLKSEGIVTLVIIPRFCLWEALLIFKGKFKTASRRWFAGKGTDAHIEGTFFKCWYYNPQYVIRHLRTEFDVVGLEGLCCLVPPSYIEGFSEKHLKMYRFLKQAEDKLKSASPWKYWGDYYIISLRKK